MSNIREPNDFDKKSTSKAKNDKRTSNLDQREEILGKALDNQIKQAQLSRIISTPIGKNVGL